MTNTRKQSKAFRSQVAQLYVSLFCGNQRFANAMLYSIEAPKNKPKQQSNLRILKSRNKREGYYLGWRILTAAKRWGDGQGRNKPGHQRLGNEIMIDRLKVKARSKHGI